MLGSVGQFVEIPLLTSQRNPSKNLTITTREHFPKQRSIFSEEKPVLRPQCYYLFYFGLTF